MKTRTIGGTLATAAVAAVMLMSTGTGVADDKDKGGKEYGKYGRMRLLLESGELVPMEQVLQRIREEGRGHVLEIELERKRDRYVYEVEVVDAQDKVHEYYYDAATGEVLERGQ